MSPNINLHALEIKLHNFHATVQSCYSCLRSLWSNISSCPINTNTPKNHPSSGIWACPLGFHGSQHFHCIVFAFGISTQRDTYFLSQNRTYVIALRSRIAKKTFPISSLVICYSQFSQFQIFIAIASAISIRILQYHLLFDENASHHFNSD